MQLNNFSCTLNSTDHPLGFSSLGKQKAFVCADPAKVHQVSPTSHHFITQTPDTQTGCPCVFQRGNFLAPWLTSTTPDCLHSQGLSRAHLAFETGEGSQFPRAFVPYRLSQGGTFLCLFPTCKPWHLQPEGSEAKWCFPKGNEGKTVSRKSLFLNSWPYETFERTKTVDSFKNVEYDTPELILRAMSWLSNLNDLVITFWKGQCER